MANLSACYILTPSTTPKRLQRHGRLISKMPVMLPLKAMLHNTRVQTSIDLEDLDRRLLNTLLMAPVKVCT